MTLDLIIISFAKTRELGAVTQRAIDSALENAGGVKTKVYIIEGNPNVRYERANTFYQKGEFNYNRYLNYGASLGASNYIAFCNNDLAFGEDWLSKLIEAMESNQLDSVSPYSHISHITHKTGILPNTGIIQGHKVKHQFEGWCFVWRRSLWDKLQLDERITFWCSDDATAEQLKQGGYSHGLVTYAFIEHEDNGGKTLKTAQNRRELTTEQAKIFNRLYDKNVENAGK